ncbi:MAG: helix-turn-helix transcriptional regulator [Hyphomonadaceae bacterium]|nr:helix-turn-helix transcriptional regulator [Hyphomonadaceae bacterium]
MLTQHLKEMKSDRIVTRTDYKEVPPRVDYNLTALAHSPSEALVPLCSWGTENMVEVTRVLAERVTWSSSAN